MQDLRPLKDVNPMKNRRNFRKKNCLASQHNFRNKIPIGNNQDVIHQKKKKEKRNLVIEKYDTR